MWGRGESEETQLIVLISKGIYRFVGEAKLILPRNNRNNTRQYLKPSAKLCDLDYKCYQNCELCGSTEGTLPRRGAADWGLENGVGFGSAEGRILEKGASSSWGWEWEKGRQMEGAHG